MEPRDEWLSLLFSNRGAFPLASFCKDGTVESFFMLNYCLFLDGTVESFRLNYCLFLEHRMPSSC